ncbi:MAG: hypothetical protein MK101_05450 [Phycisphaerales bacterium]|nr:hypothetical protein [Phycisphaerales bacterium]
MPWIVFVSAGALIVGVLAGVWLSPGRRVRAGAQHLAGGVVFGAIAVELVPVMEAQAHSSAIIVGLALGAGLMLALRGLRGREDDQGRASGHSAIAGISIGFLIALAVDLVIDGLLISLGVAAGEEGGLLLGVAVAIETLFIGLAVAASSRGKGLQVCLLSLGLGAILIGGGAAGWQLADALKGWWLTSLLAFGTAALIWLVIEELLVEAHEGDGETLLGAAMFFVGFTTALVV